MKANELRIGNYVNVPGIYKDISEVLEICEDRVNLSGLKLKFHAFYPIPLTEEWLVRFGFFINNYESDNFGTTVYQFKNFAIYCNASVNKWLVCYIDGVELESVHQLQNLYFALTGEELKLNEETL
jgi:hypothetical protein